MRKKCCALPIFSISSGPSAFTGFYMYPKGLMAGKDKRICLPEKKKNNNSQPHLKIDREREMRARAGFFFLLLYILFPLSFFLFPSALYCTFGYIYFSPLRLFLLPAFLLLLLLLLYQLDAVVC